MSVLRLVGLAVCISANILQVFDTISLGNSTVLRSSLRNSVNERSQLSLLLDFDTDSVGNETGSIQVIVAESKSVRNWLKLTLNHRVDYEAIQGKCEKKGLNTKGLETIHEESIEFSINHTQASIHPILPNLTEGVYYTITAYCEGIMESVHVNGTVEAQNPYGYLPGEAYPCLTFYKMLTGLYAVVLFVWTALICLHRDSTIALQRWAVTCVLLAALFEYMFTFALCEYMNDYGVQQSTLVICAAVTKAFKDTFTRGLMVAISKGVGVIRDSMERPAFLALLFLCSSYLISHLIYEAELYQSLKLHRTHPGQILSSLFLSVCSTVLFYWIYVSLLATTKELKMGKQTFKLGKMKQVAYALEITAIWAISWIFFQSYFLLTTSQDDYWRIYWLFEGMWQLIFLFVVSVLAWLWRPDEQWTVRANSVQLDQDDELETDKQGLEMVSQRTVGYLMGTEAQD